MAVPAQCQPRTEVLELTRGMVDRSNTNFLVWPLCVEVQRCSGCCNTHSMHCRPTRVQPRHLQVRHANCWTENPIIKLAGQFEGVFFVKAYLFKGR